ncbi:MAG TPA: signal recognition particle-docking protein FtsY [Candidatus Binatus sp.]|uniref:signal recognition particle-docking protein FtsY n=1 Tax=Candidatus Binatus sp. TaxID=2811406 RepID=UPI002B4860D6|nr:signal recognition particle-docking protein FtsY [Candidatus Binatus sp.]HKN13000.1 signal recognition particle-docking protein FtsY [Candidatus Binatus sp.]
MTPLQIAVILIIAAGGGAGLVFIGVLIQWSLRKALPSRPPHLEIEPAPEAELVTPPKLAPEPTSELAEPVPIVEPEPHVAPPPTVREPVRIGLGLRKTRENFLARIRAALTGSAKLDDIYEGLEEALIAADVGVDASMKITSAVRAKMGNDNRPDAIRDALKAEIATIMMSADRAPADSGDAPLVIMLVGVNGVGKTTTIAKLAARLKAERGSVIVAAADTFRAAAIEQLEVWCDRAGADIIKQSQGSDPAAVAFDAVKAAVARKTRTVLIDTAGRLQTKVNLMEELKKIARVVARELPGAPHETWLVLDANTGQNALSQASIFGEAVPLTGVVLAKLDSTAKGGVVVAVAERLKIPVRFVGLGESIEDLREFDAREFVDALFASDDAGEQSASGSYAA